MSSKRRANVMAEYVEESSSEDDRNDARDEDFDVSSSGRSLPGRQDSVASNASSESRRRGRGVSKRPCLNRNALMARENRQRKKEYLEKIENKLSFYRQENKNLTNVIKRQDIDLKRLRAEVSYLRNVLNNSSSITTLLKSMNDTLSVKKNSLVGNNAQVSDGKAQTFDECKTDCRTEKINSWTSESFWRRGGKYADRNSIGRSCETPSDDKKARSLGDSDHTYTTSRDGSVDEKTLSYGDSNENSLCGRENGVFGEVAFGASSKDRSAASLLGLSDNEMDELPQFDANIFDSLANCNDAADSVDYYRESTDTNTQAGNLFESLENSGICLHVNSGKISLEFCSICHLNSINSLE